MSLDSKGYCAQFSPRLSYTVLCSKGDIECAIGWPKRYPWRSTCDTSGMLVSVDMVECDCRVLRKWR
jgi:hypothetical protein